MDGLDSTDTMYLFDASAMPPVVSVGELSAYLKTLLAANDILQHLWVQGEVSNCKTYSSGHCYFTLKEGEAQLNCVFFKHARVRSSAPDLRDGMAIVVNGRIAFYERDGKLQLYVENVRLFGTGALFQRFEQLKARLSEEGLFAEERKRPLPERPAVIGIVTSPQAAALRDMLRVLRSRYPLARVMLSATLVQGAEAPTAIAAALDLLNEQGEADVIIVGRGGGSIEELWAFNEEIVARAIARSRIPVITGVGHETDFTIADFVSDYRASTPTAAATAAVPNMADWRAEVEALRQQLTTVMQDYLYDLADQVTDKQRELQRSSPLGLIERRHQQLDEMTARLQTQMEHVLAMREERLRSATLRLHSLSPLLTIARGYAIVRRQRDRAIVTDPQEVQNGEMVTIQLKNGSISARVQTNVEA